MPSYDYRCEQCHEVQEHFLRITSNAAEKLDCGKCGGVKCTVRQFSAATFSSARLERERKLYPYVSKSLPLQFNPKTGKRDREVVVESVSHEREIMAGALNGERFEKGQIDKTPTPTPDAAWQMA